MRHQLEFRAVRRRVDRADEDIGSLLHFHVACHGESHDAAGGAGQMVGERLLGGRSGDGDLNLHDQFVTALTCDKQVQRVFVGLGQRGRIAVERRRDESRLRKSERHGQQAITEDFDSQRGGEDHEARINPAGVRGIGHDHVLRRCLLLDDFRGVEEFAVLFAGQQHASWSARQECFQVVQRNVDFADEFAVGICGERGRWRPGQDRGNGEPQRDADGHAVDGT